MQEKQKNRSVDGNDTNEPVKYEEGKEINFRKTSPGIIKYAIYSVFILVFLWVSSQLFFETQTENALASVKEFVSAREEVGKLDTLRVIYPDEPASLEPTLLDPTTRQRTLNIYEPLVSPDRDLKIKPTLALSWGLITPTIWEFRLRPNVKFHDGSSFDIYDVAASFERASSHEGSQVAGFLDSIKKLEIIDEFTLRIETNEPDPLLLQKLSMILIIPSEFKDEENIMATGTGPYRFIQVEPGEKIKVERFQDYWGSQAKFSAVDMISKTDKNERVRMFANGDADLLAFVPFDAVSAVKERNFEIAEMPSLEVQFLLFNMDSKYFKERENREAFSLAIDQDGLTEAVGGYARPVSQFVSNGIFGFNPDIAKHEYNLKKAEELVGGIKGKTLHFHLPVGMDVLGEHVRQQLAKIGVFVVISYLDMPKLLESIEQRKADLYFFGFKSDLGDSVDFLNVIVHSDADFNVGNYENAEVDSLIEKSLVEMDPSLRLDALQEAMRIIVEDDIFGVPLFEYETLFSFSDKLEMQPRIDGFIYFDELKIK